MTFNDIYKKTLTGVLYSSGFALTLVGLSLVTTLVIMAVTSNVVLSLGMVGALSIVRFRTAIKEPVEIVFLFWSLAVGIVIGAGMIPLAVIGSAIIAAGMAAAVCLCLCTVAFSGPIAAAAGETGITMAYETALFDTSSVLGVNLNNNYADATNMKEALIYDMYQYLGADASLYNYAKLSVNGEYWGVYLALEAVEDSFLLRNYGVQDGELYKPDSMNIGGGKDFGDFNADDIDFGDLDLGDMTLPDRNAAPAEQKTAAAGERPADDFGFGGGKGGFSMSGGGADLNYTDDELDSYETIWDGEITDTTKADHKRVVTALKNISEGNALEDYMDVDNLLRYMAVHVFSVNEDSLSGMMAHNYYLYEAGGKLNLIPWDYNLAPGGMGRSNDATSVVNDAIDNAFSGTTFFDTLMENETYHSQYYAYLQQLVSEYIDGGGFDAPAASETRTAPDMSDGPEHTPSAGFGPSQFSGEGQNADDPQQTAEDAPASGDAASGGRPDPGSFPGSSADTSAAIPTNNLLLYALSLLPLTAALLFALLYRRRPRKQ